MDEVLSFILRYTTGRNGFVLELALCELLFLLPAKTRKYAFITIPVTYIAYFAFGWFWPFIPQIALRATFICSLIFAVSMGFQFLCYKLPFKRVLFNCSSAYILQNLCLNVREFFRLTFGWSGIARILLELLIEACVMCVAYFVLARRSHNKHAQIRAFWVVLFSLLSMFVANILFSLLIMEGLGHSPYTKLISIVCCALAICFQFSVLHNEQIANDKRIVEQLLINEQKQHKMSQENIDLINIKCHDLKKQIGFLKKSMKEDEAKQVLEEVEEAVMLYGDIIKTGNENLDLVLTEKQLYCKRHGIRIEAIADGASLDFMSPADIYSLFSNAFDNALESLMKTERANRIISLQIRKLDKFVCVKISNYCDEMPEFDDDLPVTTHKDKNYHGFGVRSMKYVVEKYNGNIVFNADNNVFSANIMLQIPKNK